MASKPDQAQLSLFGAKVAPTATREPHPPAVLRLRVGDITEQSVDAIVNAANTSLLGGGGVDGAIHRRGGRSILEECQQLRARGGGCKTGSAVVTGAGRLAAQWVIHAVGPRWRGGEHHEAELLCSAYENALRLAREKGARTVALPAISTGAYRYPVEEAARLTLGVLRDQVAASPDAFDDLRLVVMEEEVRRAFVDAWPEVLGVALPPEAPS